MKNLFGEEIPNEKNKTYRAIRHDYVRTLQSKYVDALHHPLEKIYQIEKVLGDNTELNILEMFAGKGNLTNVYKGFGKVTANELKHSVFSELKENNFDKNRVWLRRVDSFIDIHNQIANKTKYDVVDLDPYGFPNRLFPHVFLLLDDGYLFVTMPKPYVNILNGITQSHLISYYGVQNPSEKEIIERIVLWGICHWREVELISCLDCKSVWRFAFKVKKVKATEYTGVKNR